MKSPLAAALSALMLSFSLSTIAAPAVLPLWPGEAPGSKGKNAPEQVRLTDAGEHIVSSVHQPSLTVYLPTDTAKQVPAVLVIPGGGHRELWMDHEGYRVAEWLAQRGIAAFVLKYRLAREVGSTYRVERESLRDAQRALQLVRSRAAEWHVDPLRVGVMGFSAGGELAGLLAQSPNAAVAGTADAVAGESTRPAFQALIYPGGIASLKPGPDSPPAFLLCGAQDYPEIANGVAQLYLAFQQHRVPVELHVYAHAGHGFGVRATNHSASAGWLDRFHEWLRDSGWAK